MYRATWVKSQKGTQLLQDGNGYKYRVYRSQGSNIAYRCIKKDGLNFPSVAYISKDNEPPMIQRISYEHNHGADILPVTIMQSATWVKTQMGTQLLQDGDGYNYRV